MPVGGQPADVGGRERARGLAAALLDEVEQAFPVLA